MASYKIKDNKIPESLKKYFPNSQIGEASPQKREGAFFSGEEATKTIDTKAFKSDGFFNPFIDDDEPKKKSRSTLKSFLGNGKKVRETSDEVLDTVDEIYSTSTTVMEIDRSMKDDGRLDIMDVFSDKKKKERIGDDKDGENDEYEIENSTIESIYDSIEEDDEEDDEDDEFFVFGKNTVREKREYLSPDEKEEFCENYKRRSRKAFMSVLCAFAITVLLFMHESPSFPHPVWLTRGKYGILYLFFDLQLLLLSAVCIFDRLQKGVKSLFAWSPTKDSISFVLFSVSALQVILHLIFDRYSETTVLFSSVSALCALVNAIANYLDIRREALTFKLAATETPKHVTTAISENSEEYSAFSEYLPENPIMYSLTQTKFVSKFVNTFDSPSGFNEIYKIIFPLVVFTSALFALISNIMAGAPTFGKTVDNFVLAIMISMPIASIFTVSLPFFKGALKLSRRGCAVIGDASLEKISSTSVISFKDTDAFHEKGIKITSVKTYGETRIDTAILTAARVFNITGGPLKAVFNRSIIDPGSSGSSENDEVMQILPSSILSIIDGKKVLLGNKTCIQSMGIDCSPDGIDDMFENSGGKIMYMTIDDNLAAKFYIKYTLGKNFKAILDSFYDLGICMAIKSCDPNLDTEYLTKLLHDENYPIVILKLENTDTTALEHVSEKEVTGAISNTSIPNMLRTVIWCDKCRRIIGLNNLAKYVGIILSVIILIFCLFSSEAHEKITPITVLLYQLIWSIPIFGTSLLQ